MDFNDIKLRLSKTLASMSARFDENVRSKTIFRQTPTSLHVTFGDVDEGDSINNIFIILHNLASLKDHLQQHLINNKGFSKANAWTIVETSIKGSVHLQILLDLVNAEKHGYPATKHSWSKKYPVLKNISGALIMTENNAVIGFSRDGKVISSPSNKVGIYARVEDDKGNLIFFIDELIEGSFQKFEGLAKSQGII
jgi:hypothetical protein